MRWCCLRRFLGRGCGRCGAALHASGTVIGCSTVGGSTGGGDDGDVDAPAIEATKFGSSRFAMPARVGRLRRSVNPNGQVSYQPRTSRSLAANASGWPAQPNSPSRKPP